MTVTYELRAHSRNVNVDLNPEEPGETPVGKHTGYDLITYVNGVPTKIESVDLYRDNGNINFDIRNQLVNRELYEATGEVVGTYIWYNNEEQLASSYFLGKIEYQTTNVLATDQIAVNIFNKIKLEATLLSDLSTNLDYNLLFRNCNTCTNYFGQKYLGINNVCSMFLTGSYAGAEYPFYDPDSTDTTDVTIKTVRNILDKYNTLVSGNIDLDNIKYGVVKQSDGWYVRFSSDEYKYVFAGAGSAYIVDTAGDSVIYADTGSHTIYAGDGNDFVEGGQFVDTVYSGSGFNNIYTYGGDDVVYTNDGMASDYNEVYLGAGSDKFFGGDGNDTVDGGNGNGSHDNGNGNLGVTDTVEDINEIDLGGGNNKYYGTVGRDFVTGSGFNTVYLGAGSDEYTGGDGTDIVDGGSLDSDYSHDDAGDINVIHLGGGTDSYQGGMGADKVWGGNDDDTLYGNGGHDFLYGEDGNDFLYGGDGYDNIDGGAGNDYIEGGSGNDNILAGTGYDIIDPGTGVNDVDCGEDNVKDVVRINTDEAGIDTLRNIDSHDEVWCYGGFDLGSIVMSPNDIIIYGNYKNKIIFENVGTPGTGWDVNYNMPDLVQPDGTIWEWGEKGYRDSGRKGTAYGTSSNSSSSLSSQNASDLLTQALSTFGADSGSRTDMSETGGTVSEMYDLACGYDLTKKTA